MRFSKKVLCFTLCMVVAVTSIILLTAFAADEIQVVLDGKTLTFDVPPTVVDGRTLVPLRGIFESLNMTVDWDEQTQTVTANKPGKKIVLTIDQATAYVNDSQVSLDVPPMVINGRTLVPVRFISESLGAVVSWDEATQTVTIVYDRVITIKDENFLNALREEVYKPTGDIMLSDVEDLETLELTDKGIKDLSGIEQIPGLTSINFSNNEITSIKPLSEMIQLEEIDVSNNFITDLMPIKNLDQLSVLSVYSNPLSNVDVLREMSSIEDLYLYGMMVNTINKDANIDRYAQVAQKAKSIVAKLTKNTMTDLEKEIILHDYLVANTKYDMESYVNVDSGKVGHTAYGALFDGVAFCDGYSYALQMLLNFANIKCLTVYGTSLGSSLPIGHAWNMVKIDGNYYHVDATFNNTKSLSGEVNAIGHKYFNISSDQISFSHKFYRDEYPTCDTDNPNHVDLLSDYRIVDAGTKFYVNLGKNLFAVSKNTSVSSLIIQEDCDDFTIYNDEIYYISSSDSLVWVASLDGKTKQRLGDIGAIFIGSGPEGIYYLEEEGTDINFLNIKKLFQNEKLAPKTDLEQKNLVGQSRSIYSNDIVLGFFITGDNLFIKSFDWGPAATLLHYSAIDHSYQSTYQKVAGVTYTSNDSISYYNAMYEFVRGNQVYYLDPDGYVYEGTLGKSQSKKISSDPVRKYSYDVCEGFLSYLSDKDGNFYLINLNTKEKINLSDKI